MSTVIIITPKPPPKNQPTPGGRASAPDAGDDSLRIELDEIEGETAEELLLRAADAAAE